MAGLRPVFYSDDSDTNGNRLRQGTSPTRLSIHRPACVATVSDTSELASGIDQIPFARYQLGIGEAAGAFDVDLGEDAVEP